MDTSGVSFSTIKIPSFYHQTRKMDLMSVSVFMGKFAKFTNISNQDSTTLGISIFYELVFFSLTKIMLSSKLLRLINIKTTLDVCLINAQRNYCTSFKKREKL